MKLGLFKAFITGMMRLAHTHFNLLLIDMILVCIFVCLRSVWSQSCLSGLLTTVGDSKETHIAKNSSLNATFCGQYSFSGKPTGSTSNRSCFTISYRIPSDREYEYLSFKERDVWQHKFGCDVKGTLCNHQESGKCSKRIANDLLGVVCCCNGDKCNKITNALKLTKTGVLSCYVGINDSKNNIHKTQCGKVGDHLDSSKEKFEKKHFHMSRAGHKSESLKPFFCYNISYPQLNGRTEFHCDLQNHCLKLGMPSPYVESRCMKVNMPYGNKENTTATVCCCNKDNCNYSPVNDTGCEKSPLNDTGCEKSPLNDTGCEKSPLNDTGREKSPASSSSSSVNKGLIVACTVLSIVLLTTFLVLLYKKLSSRQNSQPPQNQVTYDKLLASEA